MKKPPAQCPPLDQEDNVRDEFSERVIEQASVHCPACRWGHPLVRVGKVAYFHKGTDGLGGLVSCKARKAYQDAVRAAGS